MLEGDTSFEGAVIELDAPAVVTPAADAELHGVRVLPALVTTTNTPRRHRHP